MSVTPGISVVVPVYNGAASLDELIERLEPVLRATGGPFEVVLVNDGSADDSWERIERHAARHDWVYGINLMRNYGQHNALLCGVRAARFATTVTMDDDLQNPPEEMPKLLGKLAEGHDVVYGSPLKKRHSPGHKLGSKLLGFALGVALGARIGRISSPYRAFRTVLRGAFVNVNSPWVILDVYLTWATQDFASIEIRHDKRQSGRSTYSLKKRAVMALDMITGFSTLPLKIASLVGFFFTLFGIGVLIYVVSIFFIYDSVPGFPFIASTIAIFSGAQLFALGILGEYLARMFDRVMDRPAYSVLSSTRTRDTD